MPLRALASIALVCAIGLTACGGPDGDVDAGPDPRPKRTIGQKAERATGFNPTRKDFEAVRDLLDARSQAVIAGDRAAFLAGVDAASPEFVAAQAVVFDNLQDLNVSQMYYGVEAVAFPPAKVKGRAPLLHPEVVEHAQIAGSDTAPVGNKVNFTFVRRDGKWLLGAERFAKKEGDFGDTQSRPWGQRRVSVTTRGALTVVIDADRSEQLEGLADAVESGIAEVSDLLNQPDDAGLVVDATSSGTVDMVNNLDGAGAEAAATTSAVFATTKISYEGLGLAGWRIKINPTQVDDLIGNDQVLLHELTHYVLRDAGVVPLWLSEGIAEYVGWSPTSLAELKVSADLYDRIKTSVSRSELIDSGVFSTFPDVNYLTAFATVSELVDIAGEQGVMDLIYAYQGHAEADRGDSYNNVALRRVFGITEAELAERAYERVLTLQH